jgi:hypothetical protein
LSRDHSLSWELEGQRTAGVDEPIPKNIITRSLGPQPRVDVDVEGPFPVDTGDVFVLCSDGLSGQVADEEIGLLAAGLSPDAAAAALVGLTLVRGAPDNVTVIVARAGRKEASQVAPGDPPWPLTDETANKKPQPLPVKLLAGAAASLLTALVFNPWSGLMVNDGVVGGLLGPDLAFPLALILSVTMALLFISCLLAAVLFVFASSTGPVRVLLQAQNLGAVPTAPTTALRLRRSSRASCRASNRPPTVSRRGNATSCSPPSPRRGRRSRQATSPRRSRRRPTQSLPIAARSMPPGAMTPPTVDPGSCSRGASPTTTPQAHG